jgi:xanthine dehydrogenase YagR molybdenum-binding subunit
MAKKRTTVEMNNEFREVLVEVPESEPAPWLADREFSVVGKATPRLDGSNKVTGRAKYTYDINLPHMLWLKILRSPYPHARVQSISTRRARALPGVRLVLTPQNIPDIPFHNQQSKLLDTTMRHVGDEVAVVVADTEAIANEAVNLIDVDYEELPSVLDAEQAMEDSAPVIHGNSNIHDDKPSVYERGDVAAGLAEADFVFEETFRSPVQIHSCLETHCAVAKWSGGKLTVWKSTQAVHPCREYLARVFGIPISDVRVICLYSGGGFGCKLWLNKHTILAALAARETGRPVKVVLDRKEEAHSQGNRPGNVISIKAGCKKEGTLTALSLRSLGIIGGYTSFWWGATCGSVLREVYQCPNVRTEEYEVFINADPVRPHRAPGNVQGTWAMEQVIDALAEKCGLDPLEFRLRNYAERSQTRNNIPYTQKGLREAYEQGAERFGWQDRAERKRRLSNGARKRGYGMASAIWGGGGGPPAYAIVKLFRDGTASVLAGAQDIGTGSRTILWMVAAEELGLPPEKVNITIGDTQSCPYGFVSGGSLTIGSMSPTVRMAAADAKRQLLLLAAKEMDLPASQLDTHDGYVFDTLNPSTRKPVGEVTAKLRDTREAMIIGTGFRGPNPDGLAQNTWGAQFAEVEVDTDTGKVRVLRIVAAHESGRVINPLTFSSQVEGGVIQGMGFALFEQRVLSNRSGRTLNANLHDYKLPTPMDIPEIEVVPIDKADVQANSVGVKGLGEPPIVPTAGAIANAVYDAVGVRVRQAPMVPQRVLEALEEGGRRE